MKRDGQVIPIAQIARRIAELERKLKKHDAQSAPAEILRELMLQRRQAGKTCGRSLRQPNMGFIETDEDQDSVFPIVTVRWGHVVQQPEEAKEHECKVTVR
jgi:hypothetical protein